MEAFPPPAGTHRRPTERNTSVKQSRAGGLRKPKPIKYFFVFETGSYFVALTGLAFIEIHLLASVS